ncbi:thiol-activated cytolysin family protein [Capnocytophaga catalasegens]|uniref:Flavomodulin n=1 Tax=Capnocytophaga catalasegens TaxID=1004260 RepID=A0AAV5B0Z8_9FLAO|nr:thiol-activated cytolysin family protein [Capnocytophaga catalasegens]GIZ14378.1 flavomodulin [Capnocytophaga catalasegens]GJM51498.1 flavomodulin [Capnocytophaga catalasegens]GJM53402.1 flavomodulin [Capnocytophaga catalasegens]
MKLRNFNPVIALLIGFTAVTVSCNKSDSEDLGERLAELKAVIFPDESGEVVNSKVVRDLGNGKKEVLKEVKKSFPIDPVELIDEKNADVIYPGSILRGDSFMEGGLDPVVLTAPKEITISISLRGKGLSVKKTSMPSVSNVRQQMNDLITDNKIEHDVAPSYLNYYANIVETSASFNKAMRTHGRASALFGLAKGSFNREFSFSSSSSSKYVLIKVRQFFYNIAVDPKPYDQWGDMNNSNLGSYEPVYISSVDYGRVAHLLIETNESAEQTRSKVEGALRAGFLVRVRGGSTSNEDYARSFNSLKKEIITLGGPLKQGKAINDLDSFIDYLHVPNAEELIKSAVPISYKIRTVRDNKEVQVRTFYTEKISVRE